MIIRDGTHSPDYGNSVKDSISAVESAVRSITGEKSVGVAKPLRKVADRFEIHPALRDGFEKLYAFTSDEQGVHMPSLEKTTINQDDARYVLVSAVLLLTICYHRKYVRKRRVGANPPSR